MRKAILVAMADEFPFDQIHREFHPKLEGFYSFHEYDVFYVSGRKQHEISRKVRRRVEEVRWGKYAITLRLYDLVALSLYKLRIPESRVEGRNISVDIPEDLRHLSIKILSALDTLRKLGYQFVVRTTVSSIIDPRVLDRYLPRVDTNIPYYGGRVNRQSDGFNFVSGSFTVLNASAIELLFSSKSSIDFSLIDDVAFGKFFQKSSYSPISIPSIDVGELNSEKIANLAAEQAHYRCRTGVKERFDLVVLESIGKKIGIV